MKTLLTGAASAVLVLVAAPAFAQSSQTTVVEQKPSAGAAVGVVGGAATGAAVGGPVGAVIGGVAGAVAGAVIDPPAEVKTYITTTEVAPVTHTGELIVGRPLPGTVQVYEVPKYEKYRWTFIDGKRVLIDTSSRNVVAIIE